MPRNGSGTYTLPQAAFVNGTTADATAVNSNNTDIASALTFSIAKDGQTPPTANLPMGNFKLTGLGSGTSAGDSVAYGQTLGNVTMTGSLLVGLSTNTSGGPVQAKSTGSGTSYQTNPAQYTATGSGVGVEVAGLLMTDGTNSVLLSSLSGGFGLFTSGTQRFGISMGGTTTIYSDAVTGGNNYPLTNNATTSGVSANRWANVYSVLGNFSGALTASAGITTTTISASGINFGGSTLSNFIEETAFTPVLTGIGSPTYTTQTGTYQRIGNKIKFICTLVYTGGNNAAAITGVTGLPTTVVPSIQPLTLVLNILNGSFSWSGAPIAYMNGSSTIQIGIQTTATNSASLVNPSAGTKELYIAGEYFV